ncbi:MAG: phosphopantetheine-binding protein, partial [Bacteroidota bacterium]
MNTTVNISAERSVENFRGWLHHEIAKSSVIPFAEIDFNYSFAELGLSSIHVVRLTGEMERLLDIELESSLLKGYATVEEMCEALLKMRAGRQERQQVGKRKIQIAASFTAEPLKSTLDYLLHQIGAHVEVNFAGYNQVFQELLNPGGLFHQHTDGLNIVLVRIEDWYRFEKGKVALTRVAQDVKDFIAALHTQKRLMVALVPHSPKSVRKLGLSEVIETLDQQILQVTGLDEVTMLDLRKVAEQYPIPRIWDESRDEIGHIPFTNQCYAAIGLALSRSIYNRWFAAPKVIVLDCDNTLWGGVTGEAGPE